MIVKTLTDKTISMKTAEKETGFVKGLQTWPFTAMFNLSNRGITLNSYEKFNAKLFSLDIKAALLKQTKDKELTKDILKITNISKEQTALKNCLTHPNINFINRIPNISDIKTSLNNNKLILTNVNARTLNETQDYSGHFVIIEQFNKSKDSLILQNPGPPAIGNQEVSIELFNKSWHYVFEEKQILYH